MMPMPRLKNWPSRLAAVVAVAQTAPFEWGAHDCCLWAADAVLACTGQDLAAAWRGTYSTAAGAAALLHDLGGLQAVAAMAGPAIEPALAGAGDVGLLPAPDDAARQCLAVHSGTGWLVVGSAGLLHCPPEAATSAWGVGHG